MTTLIADIALAVTVVLGLGSIAALVLRRCSPALRHAAWRATLAGVWLAPLAVVAAGMLPVQRPEIAVPVPRYEPAPNLESTRPRVDAVQPDAGLVAETTSGRGRPDSGVGEPAPREPLPLAAILLGLWGAGALVASLAFARDATALRTLLAEGAPSDRPATVEAIAQRLGLARLPRVRRSAEVSVPAVAGWLRPTLVLPEDGRPDEAALIHELAHVQRGDVRTLAAARLTAAVWWWHPLAWLMLRGLAATAEEACDDVVLALTGARREYAQMLTDWAERTTVAGAVNCGSHGKGLVARVRRVLDEHVRPVTRLSGAARVAVVACALLAVVAAGAFGLRAAEPDADGITTVLLMGVDARPEKDDRGRADAITVLFVNRETDRAALLSLPRDLRVTIRGIGENKLNAAYPMGGPELVRETVEGVLGIAIDHYAQLDMAQFPEVVDALGGVTVDVPDVEGSGRGMNYDDDSGNLHIHLKPGLQHLDGKQALGYVTYRKGDSDFARQKRQQQLLRALLEQKLRDRPVVELTETVPPMAEAVETDMSWRELIDLARGLREVPEEGLLATDMTEYLRDLHVGGVHYVEASDADIGAVLAEMEGHLGAQVEADMQSNEGLSLTVTGPEGETIFTEEDAVYFFLNTWAATPLGQPLREVGRPVIVFEGELPAGVTITDTRLHLDGETLGFTGHITGPRGYVPYSTMRVTDLQREAFLEYFDWGEAPEPEPGTGTVEVRARFADGSRPLPARCFITPEGRVTPQMFEPDIVGADGDWTIHNVPPGEWHLSVTGPGFPGVSPRWSGGATADNLTVQVSAGETEEVSVTLSRGGTVTGEAVGPDGKPAAGLEVVWVAGGPSMAYTESDGSYRLEHLRPETGYVMVDGGDRYIGGRTPDLTVSEGEVTRAPTVTLSRGGWIAGRIEGGPDEPPSELARTVRAIPETEGAAFRSASVDADGAFRAGRVRPGRYHIQATVTRRAEETPRWIGASRVVTVEVGKTTQVGTIELERAWDEDDNASVPAPNFLRPVEGEVVRGYGYHAEAEGDRVFHSGVDVAAPEGTPIRAAAAGRVEVAEEREYHGKTIIIDHGMNWETQYSHCSELLVEWTDEVERGQVIARVGSTGQATQPHLQWSVFRDGWIVDPLKPMALPAGADE